VPDHVVQHMSVVDALGDHGVVVGVDDHAAGPRAGRGTKEKAARVRWLRPTRRRPRLALARTHAAPRPDQAEVDGDGEAEVVFGDIVLFKDPSMHDVRKGQYRASASEVVLFILRCMRYQTEVPVRIPSADKKQRVGRAFVTLGKTCSAGWCRSPRMEPDLHWTRCSTEPTRRPSCSMRRPGSVELSVICFSEAGASSRGAAIPCWAPSEARPQGELKVDQANFGGRACSRLCPTRRTLICSDASKRGRAVGPWA
jgi:hypothetical protein